MKEYRCYIEEYTVNNALCARLRDKDSNRHIVFTNGDKKHFLQFLSVAKQQSAVMPTVFERNGEDIILVQGILEKEDSEHIYLKDAGYLFA